jgi:hypothetical protein
MPVFRSNGLRIRSVSPTGSGPLFITHIVTFAPRRFFAGADKDAGFELSSSLPQAAANAAIAAASTSAATRQTL